MAVDKHRSAFRCLLDITREDTLRRRQRGSRHKRVGVVKMREVTRFGRHCQKVEQLGRRARNVWLARMATRRTVSAVVWSTVSMRAGSVFLNAHGSWPAK